MSQTQLGSQMPASPALLSSSASLGHCGGLTLAGHQLPTKATLSLLSSEGQRRENIMKSLSVEVRTGRNHSAVIVVHKQTQLGEIN